MKQILITITIVLLAETCFADTFKNRKTGETFNGYPTAMKQGAKTQVQMQGGARQYLNLNDFEIQPNALGRQNKVFLFSISEPINLVSETEAFEKGIVVASNQGPLCILIEIDCPGGHRDLVGRFCDAIAATTNCMTVAYLSDKKYGGAFAEAAMIPMACDKIYMNSNSILGGPAAIPFAELFSNEEIKSDFNEPPSGIPDRQWYSFCSQIANYKGRPPVLAEGMFNKDVEILAVAKDGKISYINSRNKSKDPNEVIVDTLKTNDSLLQFTAKGAVETGVASKIVSSREELAKELNISKATEVRDPKFTSARRTFERLKQRYNDVGVNIAALESQVSQLSTQIADLDAAILQLNRMPYYTDYGGFNSQLRNSMQQRNNLLTQQTNNIQNLIRAYQRAASIINRQPDFAKQNAMLDKKIVDAQNQLNDVTAKILALPY